MHNNIVAIKKKTTIMNNMKYNQNNVIIDVTPSDKNYSKFKDPKKSNRILTYFIYTITIINIVCVIGLTYLLFKSYQLIDDVFNRTIALNDVTNDLVFYFNMMILLPKLATCTGDGKWIRQYNKYFTQYTNSNSIFISNFPDIAATLTFNTKLTNDIIMMQMETITIMNQTIPNVTLASSIAFSPFFDSGSENLTDSIMIIDLKSNLRIEDQKGSSNELMVLGIIISSIITIYSIIVAIITICLTYKQRNKIKILEKELTSTAFMSEYLHLAQEMQTCFYRRLDEKKNNVTVLISKHMYYPECEDLLEDMYDIIKAQESKILKLEESIQKEYILESTRQKNSNASKEYSNILKNLKELLDNLKKYKNEILPFSNVVSLSLEDTTVTHKVDKSVNILENKWQKEKLNLIEAVEKSNNIHGYELSSLNDIIEEIYKHRLVRKRQIFLRVIVFLQSTKNSLKCILSEKVYMGQEGQKLYNHFTKFLQTEKNYENIAFLHAVQKFKNSYHLNVNTKKLEEMAAHIYNNYIVVNSSYMINIKSNVYSKLKNIFDKFHHSKQRSSSIIIGSMLNSDLSCKISIVSSKNNNEHLKVPGNIYNVLSENNISSQLDDNNNEDFKDNDEDNSITPFVVQS
jgi:uncharacterized protein YihD (DUF1040 family)